MSSRRNKVFTVGLATYLVVYIGLLVPGHLSQFASDYSQGTSGYEQAQPACSHHDPSTCQICLTSGHLSAVWTPFHFDVNLDVVAPVVLDAPTRIICSHADGLSARAPPALV